MLRGSSVNNAAPIRPAHLFRDRTLIIGRYTERKQTTHKDQQHTGGASAERKSGGKGSRYKMTPLIVKNSSWYVTLQRYNSCLFSYINYHIGWISQDESLEPINSIVSSSFSYSLDCEMRIRLSYSKEDIFANRLSASFEIVSSQSNRSFRNL